MKVLPVLHGIPLLFLVFTPLASAQTLDPSTAISYLEQCGQLGGGSALPWSTAQERAEEYPYLDQDGDRTICDFLLSQPPTGGTLSLTYPENGWYLAFYRTSQENRVYFYTCGWTEGLWEEAICGDLALSQSEARASFYSARGY